MCGTPPRVFGADFQGFSLARCPSCELEFQSPRPVFAQLAEAVYGDDYHPPHQAAVDAEREWHYERQLTHLEALLETSRRDLLDVGCGAGAFIGYAGQRGWHVDGSDVVVTDWARATGVRLWQGQLPEIDFGGTQYDAVRFNHVLEHTPDPLRELQRAREVTRTGGLLMVGVPNMAGLSIRLKSWQSRLGLKRQAWKHYGALHHLWYFTPRTLRRLAERAGFDVIRVETPVPSKRDRPRWLTRLLRAPMEGTRSGGLLDLYARAR